MTRRTLNLCSILFAFVLAGCSPAAAQSFEQLERKSIGVVCGSLNGWTEYTKEAGLHMMWIGQTDSFGSNDNIMESLWIDDAAPPHKHFYFVRMFNDKGEACMISRGEHLFMEPPSEDKDG